MLRQIFMIMGCTLSTGACAPAGVLLSRTHPPRAAEDDISGLYQPLPEQMLQ